MTIKNQSNVSQTIGSELVRNGRCDVETLSDGATLSPKQIQKHSDDVNAIRLKLEKLGITEADIADAVKWARANPAIEGT